MKKFIAGILVGCIISFGAAYAEDILNAQKATFTVWVDGKQFATDKPILAVDNTAYVPVKDFSDYINAKTTWKSGTKRVDITNVPYFESDSVLTDQFRIRVPHGICNSIRQSEENKRLISFNVDFENVSSAPINIDFSKDFKLRDSQDKIVSCVSNEVQTIEPGQKKVFNLQFEVNDEDIGVYLNFIYKPSKREYWIPVFTGPDSVA